MERWGGVPKDRAGTTRKIKLDVGRYYFSSTVAMLAWERSGNSMLGAWLSGPLSDRHAMTCATHLL